ncbi:hypothetical protein V8C43DRAFT_112540 [Trichoderma afarasin]
MCPFGWRASLLRCLLVSFLSISPCSLKMACRTGYTRIADSSELQASVLTRRVKNGQSAEILAQTLFSTSRCCFFSFPFPFLDSTLLRFVSVCAVVVHPSFTSAPISKFRGNNQFSRSLAFFLLLPSPRELTVPFFFRPECINRFRIQSDDGGSPSRATQPLSCRLETASPYGKAMPCHPQHTHENIAAHHPL